MRSTAKADAPWNPPRGDEGGMGIVLLVMVAALLIGALVIIKVGVEEETGSKARTAADAAALAGAGEVADYLIDSRDSWLRPGGQLPDIGDVLGRTAAASYAGRNSSGSLAEYRVNSRRGEVTVEVAVDVPRGGSGKNERQVAAARIPLPQCSETTTWPTPSAAPTPSPSVSPVPEPSPSPVVDRSCSVEGKGVGGADTGVLRRLMAPRLVTPRQ